MRLLLAAAIATLLNSCAVEVRPFEPGPAAATPHGCQVVRERGGRC
jgi:hypothetical protein